MKKIHFVLLAATFLASACGGGGSSFNGGTPPVSGSFPIDSSNGVATTRHSYEAVMASGGIADFGQVPVAASGPNGGYAIAQQALSAEDLALDVVSLVPFGPVVDGCLGGTGTVSVSGDIAALDTLTPGDTFHIEYDLCDEGQGEVIDGIIDMTVTDFSGDFLVQMTYMLAMDVVIDTLSVATGTDTFITDGDASVTLDTTNTPYVTASVSGASTTQTSNAGSETLTNYRSDQTLDGNQVPPEFTMAASGTLDSSELPGAIDYSTTTPFRGFVPNYPSEGVLLVEGDNSTAQLTVIDENNVRIDIDNNADGVMDASYDLTWDEFLNPAP